MEESDQSAALKSQVIAALSNNKAIELRGGGSKRFYGRATSGDEVTIETTGHAGVVNYAPTELVITARSGTRIQHINQVLAEQGQQLPFEPPEMHGYATLGGTLATGFSGPARPWNGAARDHILGTRIINGRGEMLHFGGEVMKNVAGYDVSRLMVGAMGTLGLILEASLKVLPRPVVETSLAFHMERDEALAFMIGLGHRPLPVTGAAFYGDMVYLRLSGSEAGLAAALSELGGDELPSSGEVWRSLREFEHPFFKTPLPVWRIALPALSMPELPGEVLIDWAGGQWWLRSDAKPETVRTLVTAVGGHATLFRGGDREQEVFHPLPPAMQALQERIRRAFDPSGLFNPGRLTTAALQTH